MEGNVYRTPRATFLFLGDLFLNLFALENMCVDLLLHSFSKLLKQGMQVHITGPNSQPHDFYKSQCVCAPETDVIKSCKAVCAEGFISSKHSQDFRFGIVHPIPELHRKRGIKSWRKTPKCISFLSSRIAGSIETPHAALQHTEQEFIRNAGDGEALQSARQVDRMAARRAIT